MRSVLRCLFLLWLLAGIGCDDHTTCPDCGGFGIPYLAATSPENQIENIEVAYHYRDCEGYGRILAPEFVFKYQPTDPNHIGEEFWLGHQDSAATCALFKSVDISEFRLNLVLEARDTTLNDSGTPADTVRFRINTEIQMDQTDGTTWVRSGDQDMYFRLGIVALRENPSNWFLYEWDDLPTLAAPKLTAVGRATWGTLKSQYGQ